MPKRKPNPNQWRLLTPILDPPKLKPGWYFLFLKRGGDLASAGPYPTEEYCARVILTAEPCYSCRSLVFGDDFEADPVVESARVASSVRDAAGVVLCTVCQEEFIDEYTKKHGTPPVPMNRQ